MSAAAAISWLQRPAKSRNRRAGSFSGTIPIPSSFVTKMTVPGNAPAGVDQLPAAGRRLLFREALSPPLGLVEEVVDPEGEAVDEEDPVRRRPADGARQIDGLFDRLPVLPLRASRCFFTRSSISGSMTGQVAT